MTFVDLPADAGVPIPSHWIVGQCAMTFVDLPADAGVREDELGGRRPVVRSYVVAYDLAGRDNYWLVRTASAAAALEHVRRSLSRCGTVYTALRVTAVYDY